MTDAVRSTQAESNAPWVPRAIGFAEALAATID